MVIIVTGIDCSGKTTLIEQLSKRMNYEVVRGSSFQLTANKTNDELFKTFLELTKLENVIFDRFSFCNFVYAPLYEDYSQLTIEQIRLIEQNLPKGSRIIYLTADKETIIERFNTRGEEYVSEDKIDAILKGYEEVLENTTLQIDKFNTTYMSTDEIVEFLLNTED